MAKTPKMIAFVVRVPAPEVTPIDELQRHITSAVRCWGGALHPNDELFDLCKPAVVTRSKALDK